MTTTPAQALLTTPPRPSFSAWTYNIRCLHVHRNHIFAQELDRIVRRSVIGLQELTLGEEVGQWG